jgi:hypothetical protein
MTARPSRQGAGVFRPLYVFLCTCLRPCPLRLRPPPSTAITCLRPCPLPLWPPPSTAISTKAGAGWGGVGGGGSCHLKIRPAALCTTETDDGNYTTCQSVVSRGHRERSGGSCARPNTFFVCHPDPLFIELDKTRYSPHPPWNLKIGCNADVMDRGARALTNNNKKPKKLLARPATKMQSGGGSCRRCDGAFEMAFEL